MLALAPAALAHRLEGEYKILPGRKVQVESWFETGDPPVGAKVRVHRADGSLLFPEPGTVDDKGVYVFAYEHAEQLRVVISAGQGHRKELVITATELAGAGGAKGEPTSEGEPSRERGYELPVRDLLAGVALLLALGAFVLSLRNARQLAELRAERGKEPPR
jgi:hypothetical protein